MTPELQAASERYEKHKAAKSTGESPYHVIEDGARFTNLKPMLDDLRALAAAYLSLAPRIAELSLKAARWDECERLAERFTGATGATFWEIQPQQGESFAAAIDASIAANTQREG